MNYLWKHEFRSEYDEREVLIRSTFKRESNKDGLLKTHLSCVGALPFIKSVWPNVHVSSGGARAVHSFHSFDDDEEDELE